MFKYILNRLINNFMSLICSRQAFPLLRLYRYKKKQSTFFYFDFSDPTTHLGDRLFFIPLIYTLLTHNFIIKLSRKDILTNDLLENILGFKLPQGVPNNNDIVIYPRPSFLSFKNNYSNVVLVDFLDTNIKYKISKQLIDSFARLLSINFESNYKLKIFNCSSLHLKGNHKFYYLFSNYINSGKFRKFFIKESLLINKAKELKNAGFEIIHVGSLEDLNSDSRVYSFVDIDLRGKLDLNEFICLVASENILGAVTYDNFLMHLLGILNKKNSYVFFRGRFSSKNYDHHINFVNNNFYNSNIVINYLLDN